MNFGLQIFISLKLNSILAGFKVILITLHNKVVMDEGTGSV